VGIGLLLTFEEAGAFMLPGDISLLAAGVHARADEAAWYLLPLWAVSSAAMVAGASFLYRTVRGSGRFGRVLPLRVRTMIQRHGIWGIAVARLLPGMRNATVFVAASCTLPYRRFLMGLIPAAMVWSGMMLLLGWFGGAAILSAYGRLHHSNALRFGSLGLLAAAAVFVAWRMWKAYGREKHGHAGLDERVLDLVEKSG